MNTCRRVRQHLECRFDGTGDEVSRAVDPHVQHLADCADCSRYRDELILLDSLLFEIGTTPRAVENPAELARAGSRSPSRSPSRSRAWRPTLAAAGLLFSLLWVLPDPSSDLDPSSAHQSTAFAFHCDDPEVWVVEVPSSREDVHIVWLAPNLRASAGDSTGPNSLKGR